jgi:hypothetical protein
MTWGLDGAPRLSVWATFVGNHVQAILASDFFVTVTASFRVLYVFVIMEVGTRGITHFNVTAHRSADWTLQQFRAQHAMRSASNLGCYPGSESTSTASPEDRAAPQP